MKYTRRVIYSIIEDGSLRREVTLSDGRSYVHHCSKASYEAVAYAMEDRQRHTAADLSRSLDTPFTQCDVAFQFLKDRGVIETRRKRRSWAASDCVFEDAMIEYHSLREADAFTLASPRPLP